MCSPTAGFAGLGMLSEYLSINELTDNVNKQGQALNEQVQVQYQQSQEAQAEKDLAFEAQRQEVQTQKQRALASLQAVFAGTGTQIRDAVIDNQANQQLSDIEFNQQSKDRAAIGERTSISQAGKAQHQSLVNAIPSRTSSFMQILGAGIQGYTTGQAFEKPKKPKKPKVV